MSREHGTNTVFTDDTGTRAKIGHWATRGFCGLVAVAGGAVALSLVVHVPLPGLEQLHEKPAVAEPRVIPAQVLDATPAAPIPSEATASEISDQASPRRVANVASPKAAAATKATPSAAGTTPTAASSSPSTPPSPSTGGTPNEHAADAATDHPQPNPASEQGQGKGKEMRATPTHTPGGPPADPPGKSK